MLKLVPLPLPDCFQEEREASNSIHVLQAKLRNLSKKKSTIETTTNVLPNHTNDNNSTTESPKKADLRERIEKQRRLFKQIVEKGIAIYQQNQMKAPENSSTKVPDEELNQRKVPPLRLKVVRNEDGTICYEIVRPKVELHFKRSVLESGNVYKISSKEGSDSFEDLDPESMEMSVRSLTPRCAFRKQEVCFKIFISYYFEVLVGSVLV